MISILCILLLVKVITGKDISPILEKLKGVNWQENFKKLFGKLQSQGNKIGKAVLKPLLTLYFVASSEATTTAEKAMIYACIFYVIIPTDLIPRRAFKLLGMTDDFAVLVFVWKKVRNKVTPEITLQVEETLSKWFPDPVSSPKE